MSAPAPEEIPDIRANLRRAFIKSVITPLCVLVFFIAAPAWFNHRLQGQLEESILRENRGRTVDGAKLHAAVAKLDLAEICRGGGGAQMDKLRASLEQSDVCRTFRWLRWGLYLSAALNLILLGAIGTMLLANRSARRSREQLIRGYRMAWHVGMVAAFVQVLLLIPLLAYGCFELTVLMMDQYFPKLLIMIVLGGVLALWASARILLRKVPLEFAEPLSRELTPQEAPELWQAVREAATVLQTAPPDRIVVGAQFNFYVTELAVKHDAGRAEGRTLYLSYPLLKHLAADEVVAIIGHELGHFMGEDTRLTREFYPMRLKANATMGALLGAGFAGWTSFQLLNFFSWCFGETEQEASRRRELLADSTAAALTTPETIARALVKLQAFQEAFQLELANPGAASRNVLETPLLPVVREKLLPKTDFWTKLFEHKSPHPLDSHPALHVRLESLGQAITPEHAAVLATTPMETAYDRWFTQRGALFEALNRKADERLGQIRSQVQVAQADLKTEAGRQLVQQHFPEVTWNATAGRFWFFVIVLGIVIAGCVLAACFIPAWQVQMIFCLVAGLLLFWSVANWRRHRHARLVLNAEGIFHSGWLRPLKFEDVRTVVLNQQSGMTLMFHLKAAQRPIWKYAVLRFSRKVVGLELSGWNQKGREIAETIHRYLTRQIAPPTGQ